MYKRENIYCIKVLTGSIPYEIAQWNYDFDNVKYYINRCGGGVVVELYKNNKKVREILGAAIDVQFNMEEK